MQRILTSNHDNDFNLKHLRQKENYCLLQEIHKIQISR